MTAVTKPEVGDHASGRVNILLVSDGPAKLLALEAALEPLGENLVRAGSGPEAVSRAGEMDFACILLDGPLPGSFESAQRIRATERARETPILFITDPATNGEDIARGCALGAVDFLFKPYPPELLRSKVAQFVRCAKQVAELRERIETGDHELRQATMRLEATLTAAEVATWTWDFEHDRLEGDPNLARLYGVSPEEAAGAPLAAYIRAVHPDDSPRVQEARLRAIQERRPYEAEYRIVQPDGSYRWVIARGRVSESKTGGAVLRGVVLDITDRKRAEEELARLTAIAERERRLYSTILSSTPDLVYVFDREHRFSYANAALLNLWGRTWEEAIGKTCLELGYEPWHAAMHDREIEQVKATKQPVRGEVPFNGAEGRRMFDYIFVPVFGADGEVEAVAGTTRDVTERKQLEDELRQAAEDLTAADQRKNEFLAMLAHELRNPLGPIRNSTYLLQGAAPQAPVQMKNLAIIERQTKHMARMLDDLLDVSRITRGRIRLQNELLDLRSIVESAVETTRPFIDERGHRLSLKLTADPLPVEADRVRLEQVVTNLLNNAAKYTSPGGQIELTCAGHGSEAVITVADTGQGIAAEFLPQLFDLFAQDEQGLDRAQGGLGIGLTLVKRLVELHDGRVEAESAGLGRGSRFTVTLPLAEPASAPEIEAPRIDPGNVRAGVDGGLRVLVVDDNRDAAETLAQLVSHWGHTAELAGNGLEALSKFPEFRPQVVLLDIGMPGMDGYEVARTMRREFPGCHSRLIAVTGYGSAEDRQRSRDAGFDDHFTKPVAPEELERVLAGVGGAEIRR